MTRREPLRDGHGRLIGDLRLSVVDRCNFRCQYCMPAEGLPWLDRSEILTFEEIERLVALLASMGVADLRLTGGEPLVRREFPKLVAMLAAIEGLRDISRHHERLPARARRGGAGPRRASTGSTCRSTRWRATRFFEITRRDALAQVLRGLDAVAAFPEVRPIKVNAIAMRDFTERRGAPLLRAGPRRRTYQVRFIEFMPLDADRRLGAGGGADRSGDPGEIADDGLRARAAAARAARDGARLSASPTGPGRSDSSTRCPSRSAPTATASGSPPTASCAPACSRSTRPICATRCARARATTSSSEVIRDAVWRKELKHRINEPGFRRPPRSMSQIGG